MAQGQLGKVIQRIRTLLGARPGADSTDGELLERFVVQRDEAAFAALVERYGPLVHGLCRRVLRDESDADDAFQATFFVLAKKAASIRRRPSLGSWLYGVALRTAQRARLRAARRREVETEVRSASASSLSGAKPMELGAPDCDPAVTAAWNELRGVLDEEVQRLPAKFRHPVRLCYLEGKTNEEAARVLGWPKGSVQSRLASARELLRARLERRGVALAIGALGTVLTTQAAPGAVAASLKKTTIQGSLLFAAGQAAGTVPAPVIALANEVLKTMMASKLRWALALALILALGGGAILYAFPADQPRQPPRDAVAQKPPATPGLGYKERASVKAADVYYVAVSPDGKALATASRVEPWDVEVALWDGQTGKRQADLKAEGTCSFSSFDGFSFSPDGQFLLILRGNGLGGVGGIPATGPPPGWGKHVEVWDVARADKKFVLKDRTDWEKKTICDYRGAVFHPDGKRLVTLRRVIKFPAFGQESIEDSEGSSVLEFWDVASGKLLAATEKPFGAFLLLEMARWQGNQEVAALMKDLEGDDAPKRQAAIRKFYDYRGRHAKTNPQAGFLAPQGKKASFGISGSKSGPRQLAIAPDGKSVAFVFNDSSNSDWPRVWDLTTNQLSALPCKGLGTHVDFSADGTALVVDTTGQGVYGGQMSYTTEIWDLTERKLRGKFTSLGFTVTADGLLAADSKGNVNLIDVATGKTKTGFAPHAAASASKVRVTRNTGLPGNAPLLVEERQGGIRELIVTPDGKTLVTVAEKIDPNHEYETFNGYGSAPPVGQKKKDANTRWWEIKVWERTESSMLPDK